MGRSARSRGGLCAFGDRSDVLQNQLRRLPAVGQRSSIRTKGNAMRRTVIATGIGALVLSGIAASGVLAATPSGASQPAALKASSFPSYPAVTNPYLPMRPGQTLVYDGIVGAKTKQHDTIKTLSTVKMIDGIPAVVQVDTGYLNGALEEIAYDYFAQDASGNVWYMGENATQYQNGKPVSTAGSWLAGVNGARPGIVMEAAPRVGDTYLQENWPGQALDAASVTSLNSSVATPYGTWIDTALLTTEFSQLEPGQSEHKYYVAGIGNVRTVQVTGKPAEYLNLTGIQNTP